MIYPLIYITDLNNVLFRDSPSFWTFKTGISSKQIKYNNNTACNAKTTTKTGALLLPAANLARLAAGSSNCLQFWATDDERKNRLKHVERLTEKKK